MANSNTEHSKNLRRQTANKFYKEKIKTGEYAQMTVKGKADDMAIIRAAIERVGGTNIQALKQICAEWLEAQPK